MRLEGVVSSGLGRAHLFMAQSHYQEQFMEVLGSTAWPGTLNIAVSGENFLRFVALRNASGVETLQLSQEDATAVGKISIESIDTYRIHGFLRDGVSFGGATAFTAKISSRDNQIECAVLIPDLTRHTDVAEIISQKFLRETLNVIDGDTVRIELQL